MSHWRLRWRFLRGDWRRDGEGAMDRTHLRFWSYDTAADVLDGTSLKLTRRVPGQLSLPLYPLRRVAPSACRFLDRTIGRRVPGIAAGQVLLVAERAR
jgi:hypothetical protein